MIKSHTLDCLWCVLPSLTSMPSSVIRLLRYSEITLIKKRMVNSNRGGRRRMQVIAEYIGGAPPADRKRRHDKRPIRIRNENGSSSRGLFAKSLRQFMDCAAVDRHSDHVVRLKFPLAPDQVLCRRCRCTQGRYCRAHCYRQSGSSASCSFGLAQDSV
jgi:hypothetical protein